MKPFFGFGSPKKTVAHQLNERLRETLDLETPVDRFRFKRQRKQLVRKK